MLFNRSKEQLFYRVMVDATSNIMEAIQLFCENVETLDEKTKYADRIKELELKGDEYTHLVIRELNQTFVTPLDHEDILKLVSILDDILDGVEACAARFVYFHVDQPTPHLVKFGEILLQCARHLQEAFVSLQKRDYAMIQKVSIEINELENEGDRLLRECLSSLFQEPRDIIDVIKMKEIYEKLEAVTDTFEDLMNVMESVVVKYA